MEVKVKNNQKEENGADFETAIEAAGSGMFNYLVHLMAIPALFATVFESTSMSYILPVAECDLKLTLFDKGMLNAVGYGGMILSAIIWGYLADTQGRRVVILVGFFVNTVCALLSGLSQNFAMLVTFRFLGGIFINGPTATIFSYVSELHGAKDRSRAIMLVGVWGAAGTLALPLLSWAIFPTNWSFKLFNLLQINEWQIFLLVTSIPALISGIFMFYLPESPIFLMSQGRNDEALEVLRTIYSINTRKSKDSYPIKRLIESVPKRENNKNESIYTIEDILPEKEEIKEKPNKFSTAFQQIRPIFTKPLLGHGLHAFSMQFCILLGLNTIRLWLPQLFASTAEYEALESTDGSASICQVLEYSVNRSMAQESQDTANHCLEAVNNSHSSMNMYMNNVVVSASGMVGYFFAGFAVKLLGDKGLCTWGLLISGVLGIGLYWSSSSLSTLIISSVYITICSISTSSLLGVVMALFPTSLRTLVVSMALMFGRMGGLMGNILFPFFMEMGCFPPFLLCGSMILCAALLASVLPKTSRDMV